MNKKLWLMSLIGIFSLSAHGKIKTETVEYKQGDTVLEGYLAYDDSKISKKPLPGVIVVHDWMGISDDTKKRANQIAQMGYVAFAADVYGKNKRPKNQEEAAQFAGEYKRDRKVLRARAKAAMDQLSSYKFVDKNKIVAMGFCFGGTTALELARSGASLVGTVSFHGGLSTPTPEDASHIKGKVLALHGGDDPYVPATEVAAFQDEMRKGKVDWQFVSYGNSVHGFTMEHAGSDPSKGMAYNPLSEKRSWQSFQDFLKEVF